MIKSNPKIRDKMTDTNGANLGNKTKVPIIWFSIIMAFAIPAAIFIGDIRGDCRENTVRTNELDKRFTILDTDVKTELRLIRQDIRKILSTPCDRR